VPAPRPVPPEVRITLHTPGVQPLDLALSYPLDPHLAALLRTIHESGDVKHVLECRMHDDAPGLRDFRQADGRVHGIWLYLRTNPNAAKGDFPLVLCHWPGSGIRGNHAVPSPMTAEHRRRQEYIALRGQASGYHVDLEKSLARGTRSDVVIVGDTTMTAEVQQSGITLPTVLRRDRAAARAGATPAWFADVKNPGYAFQVAHVETNERHGMHPRMWTVSTGPRRIEQEKCRPGTDRPCPKTRNWCGDWHPIWTPIPQLTVDDVVERVPAAELVRFHTGTGQGTILCSPADRDLWLQDHPELALPGRLRRQRSGDARSGIRHNEQVEASLRQRLLNERRCSHCGEPIGAYPFDLHPRCYFHVHLAWSEPGPDQPEGVA